ncbi:MAG: hypothetical protein SWY16_12420 [Cyanobacteriota bacterium]|nr:hypothetical protein [Cyanobacteriota bacterium]
MLVSGLRRGVLELELELELKLLPLDDDVVDSDEELKEGVEGVEGVENEEPVLYSGSLLTVSSVAETDLVIFIPPCAPLLYLA